MSNERIKVAEYSPYVTEEGTPDGVKDYIQTLRPVLERKGVDVVLVAPSTKDNRKNLADYTLGTSVKVTMQDTSYRGAATVNILRARRFIKSEKPDINEFHEAFANPSTVEIVSLVARETPQIFQFHAQTEKIHPRQKIIAFLGKKSGYVKHVMNRVSERHAVSPDTKRFWAYNLEEDEDLYEVIPNPIDTELYSYNGQEKEKKDKTLIICTARHDKRKKIDDLIYGIDELVGSDIKDFVLEITGEGPKTPELKGLVKRLGLSDFVKFMGILPIEELVDLTARADILVASSEGGEGHNRSISNARAAGVLVVATRIPGQTFAYGPEKVFGEMCEPNNPGDLANRIKEFKDLPPGEKQKRKELGRRHVEDNFSTEVVANKKVAAYERVIYSRSISLVP